MEKLLNFLMHVFVLLPLAAIESVASLVLILSVLSFFERFEIGMTIWLAIILIILALAILVGLFFLERKIRDFEGIGFTIFFIAMMPARIIFQIFAILFAIIAFFSDSIDSDYDCVCDTIPECISYIMLGCVFEGSYRGSSYVDTRQTQIAKDTGNNTAETDKNDVDERDKKESKKKSYSDNNDRVRNICMQIFVLFPIAAAQFVLTILTFHFVSAFSSLYDNPDAQFMDVVWLVVSLVAILILSMISTAMRGHSPTEEYFEEHFKYTRKKDSTADYVSDTEFAKRIEDNYRNDPHAAAPNVDGYKHESGGWTAVISPVTIMCFLSSIFMVFTQIVSILVAIIVNPDKNVRIFPWYGKVSYSHCKHPILQRLLHFYFGFIVLDYLYAYRDMLE